MKIKLYSLSFLMALFALAPVSGQSAITVGSSDVRNLSSYTTPDGLLTLTPLIAGESTGALFSDHNNLIGVKGGDYTNAVAINNWRQPEAASEGIRFEFGDAGLSGIVFQWYGADVQITGFSSDPLASGFDSSGGSSLRDFQFSDGTLTFTLQGNWQGTATLVLDDLMASANSTLTLSLLDNTVLYETPVRTSITGISYAIPEPSTYALFAGIAVLVMILRRRLRPTR